MSIIEELERWIRGQVSAARARGAAFGLSGGLDSAVVGALCARALGERALGVIMPCMSQACDAEDAMRVASECGIRTMTIDLESVLEAILSELPAAGRMAVSNLKVRLRMVTLYYIANSDGLLVAGTSNKSERLAGYFTKWGDAAADFYPIAGIYKTDLYEVARELGVPTSILEREPSAGLWEGQTDEGEMGVTYRQLDEILKAIEEGRPPDAPAEMVERVRRMMEASEHKRAPVPMFIPGGESG